MLRFQPEREHRLGMDYPFANEPYLKGAKLLRYDQARGIVLAWFGKKSINCYVDGIQTYGWIFSEKPDEKRALDSMVKRMESGDYEDYRLKW